MDRVTDKDDKDDEDEILYFKKIQSFGKNSDDKLNFNVEVNMNVFETLFCGNDVAIPTTTLPMTMRRSGS